MDKKYNVYMISLDDFKAKKLVAEGVDVSEMMQVELRENRYIDKDNNFIAGYEVGSDADKNLQDDLRTDVPPHIPSLR